MFKLVSTITLPIAIPSCVDGNTTRESSRNSSQATSLDSSGGGLFHVASKRTGVRRALSQGSLPLWGDGFGLDGLFQDGSRSCIERFFLGQSKAPLTLLLDKISSSKHNSLGSVNRALAGFDQQVSGLLSLEKRQQFVNQIDQLKLKIVGIVGLTLPELRTEPLPLCVKDELTADKVVSFFIKALPKMCDGEAFKDFTKLVGAYNSGVFAIKETLFLDEDSAAISWKPRNPFLFVWCRILIEETGHPALQLLSGNTAGELRSKTGIELSPEVLRSRSYDAFTKFVLPLTCADDIADVVQDGQLLAHFTKVFELDEYQKLLNLDPSKKSQTLPRKYSAYKPFFELYIKTFQGAMRDFESLVGPSVVAREWPSICASWKIVMDCLRQSVAINRDFVDGRHEVTVHAVNSEEDVLAQNMLMSFFKQLEKVIVCEYALEDPSLSYLRADIIFKNAEILGHAANHWATLATEIAQGDYSNTILIMLNCEISHQLSLRETTFREYCESCRDVFVELPRGVSSFSSLLAHLKTLDQDAVRVASRLLGDAFIDRTDPSFRADFSTAISPKDLFHCVTKYTPDKEGDLAKIVSEKKRLSALVLDLVRKTNVMETYGVRIGSKFKDIEKVIAVNPAFTPFVQGVRDLVSLYLACKREI